jgi:hypothetical protein
MPQTVAVGSEANLDIANMSAQQLVAHGVPLPNAAKGTAKWQDWLHATKKILPKLHSEMPLYLTQSYPKLPTFYIATGSPVSDSGWAGWADGQGNQYNMVYADWTVPTVSPASILPDSLGEWVGLGGVTGFGVPIDLFQAGTYQSVTTSGTSSEAFYEYVNASGGPSIAPAPLGNIPEGHATEGFTWYLGGDEYEYEVYDATTGAYWSNVVYPAWGTPVNNSSAEVIAEDPTCSSGPCTLPIFSSVQFTAANAQVGTNSEALDYYAWPEWEFIENQAPSGTLTPSSWTDTSAGTSFSVTYSK